MQMADERLEGTEIRCFVSPGNDDQFEVDEIISGAKRVELAEGEVVEFGDYQMVSTGWSNRTPWDTYREEGAIKGAPGNCWNLVARRV